MKLKSLAPRLGTLAPQLGSIAKPERSVDAERAIYAPWRAWYKTARWRALRLLVFARDLYTCQWPGCGFTTADTFKLVADHRRPHRGDARLFWDLLNLQTLCAPCHNSKKQALERSGRAG